MTPEAAKPDKRRPVDGDIQRAQRLQTAEELTLLDDAAKQEEYRLEYLAQLKRRACPGCGESNDVF